MKKKQYYTPDFIVIGIQATDVLTSSTDPSEPDIYNLTNDKGGI